MDNKPKSIGDDALHAVLGPYVDALSYYCNDDHPIVVEALAKIKAMVNSRAPAAQASATIQAAPELVQASRKLIHHLDARGEKPVEFTYSDPLILALRLALVTIESAATIQEPVMVAEPVSYAGRECLKDVISHHGDFHMACQVTRDLHLRSNDRDSAAYWDKQINVLARMKLQAEAALAAPMVADPAGVARQALIDLRALHIGTLSTPIHFNAYLDIIDKALAATVKAIPSEALAVVKTEYRRNTWDGKACQTDDQRMARLWKKDGYEVWPDPDAAPLADKK